MDPCFSFSFPSSAFLLQAAGLEWTQILNWCSRYFTHTHTHQHHVRVVCPTISVTGFTSTSCRDWPAARSQESSLILYFSLSCSLFHWTQSILRHFSCEQPGEISWQSPWRDCLMTCTIVPTYCTVSCYTPPSSFVMSQYEWTRAAQICSSNFCF